MITCWSGEKTENRNEYSTRKGWRRGKASRCTCVRVQGGSRLMVKAVFVAPRWHIVTRSAPAIVTHCPEYNRLYEPWIDFTVHCWRRWRAPILASEKKKKCKVFRNSVCLFKFGNCVQQVFSWKIFSLQSLQKKRHLLEHDKHLATGLWLMGPKTEVWSVHFERWVIYPHFSFFTLGGWEKTPSPLTDSHCWMCGLIIHERGPFHILS